MIKLYVLVALWVLSNQNMLFFRTLIGLGKKKLRNFTLHK